MKRFGEKIFFACLPAFVLIWTAAFSADAAQKDWPMFLGNQTHSSTVKEPPPASLKLKWKFNTAGPIYSSPIAVGNLVYIASYDQKIYALKESDGTLVWSFEADSQILSTPVVDKDVLYVGSKGGSVYAINAETGKLVWRYEGTDGFVSSPAVGSGVVFIGSNDSYIYAIEAKTGRKSWRMKLDDYAKFGGVYSSPVVKDDEVYVAGKNGVVYSYDVKNGGMNWQFATKSAVYASPVVSGGKLYIASYDRYVYALDLKSHKFDWIRKMDESRAYASAVVTADKVYISLHNGVIKVLNRTDGKVAEEIKIPAGLKSTPIAFQYGRVDYLLAGALDGGVYVINLKTGKADLVYVARGPIDASPAVSGSGIYFGSEDGALYAFEKG